MLVQTWNVNGLRAVTRKGILPWNAVDGADVICLQETKASPDVLEGEIREPREWRSFFASAEKKGYSGTAIYCRDQPDEIFEGIGVQRYDAEGRAIGVRYGELVIVSAYFPNSQERGVRLPYKLGFCRAMQRFLRGLDERGLEVLLVGDYNIAHQAIDLARPKENEKNPGYLPEERAWMTRFLGNGYHDIFREHHPELEGAYSWWSMRTRARERNIGWRLDYTMVSAGLVDRVDDAHIHSEVHGSDHCPVSIRLS